VRDARVALLAVASLAFVASACRGRGFEPTVRRSMSADARCPEDKVQVKGLSGGVYQADGCGKTATYDCSWPEGGTRECTRRGTAPEAKLPGSDWRWP
jgi:hypothetical protein